MSFLGECEQYYGTQNLYEVLQVNKDSSADDIKKSYRKMSLLVHPDRVKEDEKLLATSKFQVLGKVYSVLSDKNKRAVYDESGIVDDDFVDDVIDWKKFWDAAFPRLSKRDMDNYFEKYWGSSTEKEDLKEAYNSHKGDMNKILQEMQCR